MKKVLVVDDEPGLRQSLGLLLSDAGYAVTAESDGKKALDRALAESFDLVLCDVRMPEMDGLAFLRSYRSRGGDALVIMMSAYGGEDAALAAMKEGAYDYLPKPFRPDEVVLTLRKAEERERLRHDVAGLRAQLATGPAERGLVAESRAMKAALDLVARVAEHSTTVLITGESGTGKEVIARAIHRASPRAARPFVGINCAAIPESLLESELFGHVRGAFTGATADKAGLFDQASGGTLLLDEIGELPVGLQAKLLRVLQEGEIRRVGDQKTRRVDVRVLAATARDLAAEAAVGRFREDLFYRINVIPIPLPPLRARLEDIAPLTQYFIAAICKDQKIPEKKISTEAMRLLEAYPWPGNVRELENTIERTVALEPGPVITVSSLPESIALGVKTRVPDFESLPQEGINLESYLEAVGKRLMREALDRCEGVQTKAAELLHMSFRSFRYYAKKYALVRRDEIFEATDEEPAAEIEGL
jgi:two-component system response regulator AtoC